MLCGIDEAGLDDAADCVVAAFVAIVAAVLTGFVVAFVVRLFFAVKGTV